MADTASRPSWCRLRTERGRYVVRWSIGDRQTWAESLAGFKAAFPPDASLRFRKRRREWSVFCEYEEELLGWAHHWFRADQILLEGQRLDDGARRAHEAPPTQESADQHDPLAQAWAALFLRPGAPLGLVVAAHRELAKTYHPDHGGSNELMRTINAARDLLLRTYRRAGDGGR